MDYSLVRGGGEGIYQVLWETWKFPIFSSLVASGSLSVSVSLSIFRPAAVFYGGETHLYAVLTTNLLLVSRAERSQIDERSR